MEVTASRMVPILGSSKISGLRRTIRTWENGKNEKSHLTTQNRNDFAQEGELCSLQAISDYVCHNGHDVNIPSFAKKLFDKLKKKCKKAFHDLFHEQYTHNSDKRNGDDVQISVEKTGYITGRYSPTIMDNCIEDENFLRLLLERRQLQRQRVISTLKFAGGAILQKRFIPFDEILNDISVLPIDIRIALL